MRVGTSMIDLLDINGPLGRKNSSPHVPGSRNVDHFCLKIDPFNEEVLLKHLGTAAVHDINPAQKRYGAEGTGLSIYFHDPDGNQIELKGPAEFI